MSDGLSDAPKVEFYSCEERRRSEFRGKQKGDAPATAASPFEGLPEIYLVGGTDFGACEHSSQVCIEEHGTQIRAGKKGAHFCARKQSAYFRVGQR